MTVSDCKRQGADQPSTRAGWSVPLLFTTMSVLKHFVDVHYYIVSIFVRFLLFVVYEFVLCSPYLEDNKVSIYLGTGYSRYTVPTFCASPSTGHFTQRCAHIIKAIIKAISVFAKSTNRKRFTLIRCDTT